MGCRTCRVGMRKAGVTISTSSLGLGCRDLSCDTASYMGRDVRHHTRDEMFVQYCTHKASLTSVGCVI